MTLEMVPQGTLVERMRAGGAGLAAIYTPTGFGSEIAEGKDIRYFDGRPYVLERAITTDFALIRRSRRTTSGTWCSAADRRTSTCRSRRRRGSRSSRPRRSSRPGRSRRRTWTCLACSSPGWCRSPCGWTSGTCRSGPTGRPRRRRYLGKPALTREQIGRRAAALLPDNSVVNKCIELHRRPFRISISDLN